MAQVQSGEFLFSHSLCALFSSWLIICSSHMLTHDLLLSFSGHVSWDISCFHQPLSFVQQQLACHLSATLLWMCPPFACSCCAWACQSVQIYQLYHSVLHLFKALLSEFLHIQCFILWCGFFCLGCPGCWNPLVTAAAQVALRPIANLYDYQSPPTVSDFGILFMFHFVLNV